MRIFQQCALALIISFSFFLQSCDDEAPISEVTADITINGTTVVGQAITFSNASDLNVTNWSWTFEGGTPATSTAQSPSVTFDAPGTYEIGLTVNSDNDEAMTTTTINVQEANVVMADIDVNARGIFECQEVTFFNTDNTNVTSWEWTFEGGTPATSTEQSPTVFFNSAGNLKATLKVRSNNAEAEKDTTITINTTNVNFGTTGNIRTIEAGESIRFLNGSSPGIESFSWTFVGGTPSTSTERNPTITYNNAGTFAVSLIARTCNNEFEVSRPSWITVNPAVRSIKAIQFDGTNDYINTGVLPTPNTANALTLAAWIKTDKTDTRIISRHENNIGYLIKVDRSGGVQFLVATSRGNLLTVTNEKVNDNQWHHVVGVYKNGEVSVYIDGQLESTTAATSSTNLIVQSEQVLIGSLKGTGEYFEGLIAEPSIWHKTLSASEVTNLFNNCQLTGNEDGLIAYWNFDTNSSTVSAITGSNNGTFQDGSTPITPTTSTDLPTECN